MFEQCDSDFVCQALACSADISQQILGRGRIRQFPAKAVLVRQGDRSTTTYLLIIGKAHAVLYSFDGQMILLHEFSAGDFFGALDELDPSPEEADIVAVEDVRSFLLEASDLVSLAERHGCIGLALARLLHRRLRLAATRMYERSALSATGRVCAELLRLAQQSDGFAIRPPPVISELALRVGTTRETASRAVNGLERRGIIRRDAEALVVVAPHRLEEQIL